ncbi:MAG: hypothetical protein K2Q03_08110 [Sphingobacteriaceae bacterium]|nr:hypothetical protein [Sphingobacteriaceae bacterium]
MKNSLYQPFKTFDFKSKNCFLSGASFQDDVEKLNILPNWLLQLAQLTGEEQIKLLDESVSSYNQLNVPCSKSLYQNFILPLDQEIEKAFETGYAAVSKLPELSLFKWIGKFMYGLIYIEMQAAIKQNQLRPDGINMGQGVMHKFGNLHTMLQSIYLDVKFEDFNPWSIVVIELENENTPFSFKDEINTLTYSLKFKNFGIVACLQDNGTNKRYHANILAAIAEKKIIEQQFEEICARFYYSSYLFNRLPEYNIMPVGEETFIEAMPLKGTQNKALFDAWQHKTYAQVLENFWKPWGHTLFEILKDPNHPLSYFEKTFLPDTQ